MAKKKGKTTKSKKSKEVLVVASKVKAYVRDRGMNTSGDAISCISEKVYGILDEATTRTLANGRKTLKPQDV